MSENKEQKSVVRQTLVEMNTNDKPKSTFSQINKIKVTDFHGTAFNFYK
jgi:hypothetical protein